MKPRQPEKPLSKNQVKKDVLAKAAILYPTAQTLLLLEKTKEQAHWLKDWWKKAIKAMNASSPAWKSLEAWNLAAMLLTDKLTLNRERVLTQPKKPPQSWTATPDQYNAHCRLYTQLAYHANQFRLAMLKPCIRTHKDMLTTFEAAATSMQRESYLVLKQWVRQTAYPKMLLIHFWHLPDCQKPILWHLCHQIAKDCVADGWPKEKQN